MCSRQGALAEGSGGQPVSGGGGVGSVQPTDPGRVAGLVLGIFTFNLILTTTP